ncbi:peptide chain release factor 1 [Candidatus Vampirococcus lugosii]|uniref:Peptide chain release factor 1 n=1 Tax=Candidatus Vampirococcus lugosii TaxID=2789015 RepID=A0ABS5QL33_9BACT|nr:peptide chain release factor 1 [Candidatus Vampirococcus lugosii]MBS8121920.1 peptide chain release factor 1 [Candidatus Vampirococcus lugosii]
MWDKIKNIENRYDNIKEQLCQSDIFSDNEKAIKLNRELSKLQGTYDLYQEYKKIYKSLNESKQLLEIETDEDMLQMIKEEINTCKESILDLEEKLKIEMLPKDPNDDKNVFMEIRPAAGGDESGLFAMELMRMYLRYCEIIGWKSEIIEEQVSDIGGLKGCILKIKGDSVFSKLKFESGVHRVQRIPNTESNGRVHTSTVTVSIMPEVDDLQVNFNKKDVDITTYAASSAGGQNANKNQTGVRVIHRPTGLIVTIGEGKSQLQNKERAFDVLKSRLFEIQQKEHNEKLQEEKSNQIGTGDRSEKIRTYNFPQDRLTDHRIKKSWSNITGILSGEIEDIVQDLILENQSKLLSKQSES